MNQKKTLQERTKELQSLLATEKGRAELQDLVFRYGASSDRVRPERTSLITYILVHERQEGIIAG